MATSKERALAGQSPYVANLGFGWEPEDVRMLWISSLRDPVSGAENTAFAADALTFVVYDATGRPIARGEDVGIRRPERRIDHDAAIDRQTGFETKTVMCAPVRTVSCCRCRSTAG